MQKIKASLEWTNGSWEEKERMVFTKAHLLFQVPVIFICCLLTENTHLVKHCSAAGIDRLQIRWKLMILSQWGINNCHVVLY